MASATPNLDTSSVKVTFNTGCETSRVKVKKKYSTGTLGPAAAKAIAKAGVYMTQKGEEANQKLSIKITPPPAERSEIQSPGGKKDS